MLHAKSMSDDALANEIDELSSKVDAAVRIRHVATRKRTLACINARLEALLAEVKARAYVVQHGPFVVERMSPWSMEKRHAAAWQRMLGNVE